MENYENGRLPRQKKNRTAVSALIMGLVSLLSLCCFVFPLSILLGVGAVCLAVLSKNGDPFAKTAVAGIALGVLGVIGGVAEFFYFMAFSALLGDPQNAAAVNQLYGELEQYLQQYRQAQ